MMIVAALTPSAETYAEELSWTKLAPLPDAHGFAGAFGGAHSGVLIVAGGANFPERKPWEGDPKVWHDTIFLLDHPASRWRQVGRLIRPLGYGVSAQTADGIVCAGGSDARSHYADVFLLRLTNRVPAFTPLPSLPRPCANASGAVLAGKIYLAGGLETPGSAKAMKSFWVLDRLDRDAQWRELEPWPGPERILATVGVAGGSFYLFGGAALAPGTNGIPLRRWLKDAYQFTPGLGWKRLPDLPRVAVAAPSPAPSNEGALWVLGGDDGSQTQTPPNEHRGFRRDILAFDPMSGGWTTAGETPFALVTTPVIQWNGRLIIPGGETRPRIRSTEVWSAVLKGP